MATLKSIPARYIGQHIQAPLYALVNEVQAGKLKLEEVGDYLPGSVMLQNIKSLTNIYMNRYGADRLRHSSEELKLMGPEYFKQFFPHEEISILRKQLVNYLQLGDPKSLFSFYQRVKTGTKGRYEWYLTTTRTLNAEAGLLLHLSLPADGLIQASNRCHYLADQSTYCMKHFHLFNALSKREKEIIALIAEGKSSYYISDLLFISIHTVNNHRKNIIRKLNIKSLAELIRFAVSFGLV
ncbi:MULTISPECIES: response regulator transcription factor [Olivibacter]|uniref:Response regulator transcription factor n=1 Tax=Olivibacter jilunii TaxID=985016 RepID=A0ABW6B5J2_9SPHI|nr:helix-turn-helix transcriptional regulator [Olivibacter jilunii]